MMLESDRATLRFGESGRYRTGADARAYIGESSDCQYLWSRRKWLGFQKFMAVKRKSQITRPRPIFLNRRFVVYTPPLTMPNLLRATCLLRR